MNALWRLKAPQCSSYREGHFSPAFGKANKGSGSPVSDVCLAGLRRGLLARHSWGPFVQTTVSVDRATYSVFAESLRDTEELTRIFTFEAQRWAWEDRAVPLFLETVNMPCLRCLAVGTTRNIGEGIGSYCEDRLWHQTDLRSNPGLTGYLLGTTG